MRMILTFMLNLIIPPRCPISGEEVSNVGELSPAIWGELDFIAEPFCASCGVPFAYKGLEGDVESSAVSGVDSTYQCATCIKYPPIYDSARAALVYNETSRALILRFKHGDHLYLQRNFIPWLKAAGDDLLSAADVIIPVPLHWTRMVQRRYNQSALLAKALAAAYDVDYGPTLLKRVKATKPQGHGNFKDRRKNVRAAFSCSDYAALKGKNILLIDDVLTSGATVNECAKTLLDAGAGQVNVLAIARAVRD